MNAYKFSDLPYTPNDFKAVQNALDKFTAQVKAAESAEALFDIVARYDDLMEQVQYEYCLCYIRGSLDCTDKFYAEAVQKEGMGCAALNTSDYYKALLDSPFLPVLEEKFGSEFRPRLEKEFRLHTAGHELLAREQVLTAQYQQKKAMLQVEFQGAVRSEGELLKFFDSPDRQIRLEARKALAETMLKQKEEFVPLLMELISVRDGIARANGFENYLEYANASYDRRGYGEAKLTEFCRQVKTELVPLLQTLQEQQRKELGLERLMSYDRTIRFIDGNAVPAGDAAFLTERSKEMYDDLSAEFGEFFRAMVETESLDVTASPHKVAGMGFCTTLKRTLYPYVFGNCNGTDTDVAVFTHEIGHAWEGYRTFRQGRTAILNEMGLDAVEIPSKTMELFTYPYADKFFGQDAEKFRQGHFRDALREIASYCQIHELNTWIYTHVGASFEEIVAADRAIELEYDPSLCYGALDSLNQQGADLMRNMAIYMFPRYVISYSLSEMCAMDLFARMQKSPEEAWNAYNNLCASGGSRNYPDTLAQAGLEPAYAPGSVRKVVEFAKEYLKL